MDSAGPLTATQAQLGIWLGHQAAADSAIYNAAQLKTLQEVITLGVFVVFSVWYLGEPIRWNHLAGFALIVAASFLIFAEF